MARKTNFEKAKEYFIKTINEAGHDKYGLLFHVPIMEKWAVKLLADHPEANKEVVLLAVWLHDIAHYDQEGKYDDFDHAVIGETKARKFLTKKIDQKTIDAVAHCVRSHRNRDIRPDTMEAKIVACVDSASHLTDSMYLDIIKRGYYDYAIGKLERDYRDLANFPEIKKELTPLYRAWKKLIEEYRAVDQNGN